MYKDDEARANKKNNAMRGQKDIKMGIKSQRINKDVSFRDKKFLGAHSQRENKSAHNKPEAQDQWNSPLC